MIIYARLGAEDSFEMTFAQFFHAALWRVCFQRLLLAVAGVFACMTFFSVRTVVETRVEPDAIATARALRYGAASFGERVSAAPCEDRRAVVLQCAREQRDRGLIRSARAYLSHDGSLSRELAVARGLARWNTDASELALSQSADDVVALDVATEPLRQSVEASYVANALNEYFGADCDDPSLLDAASFLHEFDVDANEVAPHRVSVDDSNAILWRFCEENADPIDSMGLTVWQEFDVVLQSRSAYCVASSRLFYFSTLGVFVLCALATLAFIPKGCARTVILAIVLFTTLFVVRLANVLRGKIRRRIVYETQKRLSLSSTRLLI